MTLKDFSLMSLAYSLRKIDEKRDFIENEFIKRAVNATEKRGKDIVYVYKDVKELYDFEKEERKVLGKEENKEIFDRLRLVAKNIKAYKKGGEASEL